MIFGDMGQRMMLDVGSWEWMPVWKLGIGNRCQYGKGVLGLEASMDFGC